MICQTGLIPAKNAERKHLPNRLPPEHEKRLTVQEQKATESARKMKPRLCSGEFLLDSYMDGEIDDNKFLVLWQVYQSKNPDFPHEDYGRNG